MGSAKAGRYLEIGLIKRKHYLIILLITDSLAIGASGHRFPDQAAPCQAEGGQLMHGKSHVPGYLLYNFPVAYEKMIFDA